MSIEKMLHEEITNDFEKLHDFEFGSDEYRTGAETLVKMYDRAIELKKIETDVELKKAEQKNDNRNRLIGHILTGVTTAAGIGVTVWGTIKSIRFEKDGVITTIAGKNFINSLNKFIPKK